MLLSGRTSCITASKNPAHIAHSPDSKTLDDFPTGFFLDFLQKRLGLSSRIPKAVLLLLIIILPVFFSLCVSVCFDCPKIGRDLASDQGSQLLGDNGWLGGGYHQAVMACKVGECSKISDRLHNFFEDKLKAELKHAFLLEP